MEANREGGDVASGGKSAGKDSAGGTGGTNFDGFDTPTASTSVDAGDTSNSKTTDTDASTSKDTEVCVQDNAEADLSLRPIDVIISIDTSPSMNKEIEGVQQNINDNFATIIGNSGIDYRVILISSNDVCITGTLSPAGCNQDNPPIFYWIDDNIGSHDTWCEILNTYPMWSGYLRPEAFKVFVAVTDDSPNCSGMGPTAMGAQAFDMALLALDPTQFGTATERNYTWHSLVALTENNPATDAYEPTDPIVTSQCSTGAGDGQGYQHLSQMTGGLRFPVCEGNNFDAVFRRIAEGIVDGSAVACEFTIPDIGDNGKPVDRSTIEVAYVPGDQSATIKFDPAADMASCNQESFYIDGDMVKLCPAACDAVKEDPDAQIQVLFGCDVCGGLDISCDTLPPPSLPPPLN